MRYTSILILVLFSAQFLQSQEQELPANVSRALDRYEQTVERARQDLIRSLDREEQTATRTGNLDLALVIREIKEKHATVVKLNETKAEDDGVAVLGVRSRDLTIQPLAVGVIAYTNRAYVWQVLPTFTSNEWRFVTQAGGSPQSVTVRVLEDGWIYFASALLPDPQLGAEPLGDRMVYSDPGRTSLVVYRIKASKGNWTTPPNTTWEGCILLLPPTTQVIPR